MSQVYLKPLVTEKSETLSQLGSIYSFVVDKKVNKIQIKKAVESKFNVNVTSVRTAIIPGKLKTRNTKGGVSTGMKPSYKKAYVTLTSGESIDFYAE